MQAERTALIQQVVKAVQALKPNEAIFLPGESIVARSAAGTLRFASGWFRPVWRRGDGLQMARQHAEMLLSGNPHYASRNRRELSVPSTLRPVLCANVGRTRFYVLRAERACARCGLQPETHPNAACRDWDGGGSGR